ncbi:MAG: hypothetical protein LBB53_00920 [Prevotellaceae bacterium]|nr:hypothetical protein [Prevotellaceae bacterium]
MSKKTKRLIPNELFKTAKTTSGSGLSKILKNLEYYGFIRSYNDFGKCKRDVIYDFLMPVRYFISNIWQIIALKHKQAKPYIILMLTVYGFAKK